MLPSTLLLLQNFGWSAALVVSAILIAMIVPLAWMLKAPAFVVPNTSTNQVQLSFKDILVIAKTINHFGSYHLVFGLWLPSSLYRYPFTWLFD